MQITFHGAAGCVTGSCFRVAFGATTFLVDCGMFQGSKSLKELNYDPWAFDPTSIDFVLVTHAHIDHSGLLPKLVKHGFKGPIHATAPTVDLLRFMLPDSARIQESEVEQKNRRQNRKGLELLTPIYTITDAEAALNQLKPHGRDAEFSPAPGCRVVFRDAGHVLGSSFLEITLEHEGKTKRIAFSGDLGELDRPLVHDPKSIGEIDMLIVESTYGGRTRTKQDTGARLAELARVIRETADRGGNLIIPAFALERTQALVHDMITLMSRDQMSQADIVIDSPLAIKLTEVFANYSDSLDDDAQALIASEGNLFDHPRIRFTPSAEESMALNNQKGLIILSASGMADAGRIKHHLKHNLWKPENTILFIGYQAEGTLGRLLLDGAETVRIHGSEVVVKAHIERISGYSGHANQDGLLNWITSAKRIPDRVFVVHGEDDAREAFAQLIRDKAHLEVVIPNLHETHDLFTGSVTGGILLHEHLESQSASVLDRAAPEPEKSKKGQRASTKPVPRLPKRQQSVADRAGAFSKLVGGRDSHNLYAEIMLKLADFMRRERNEHKRRTFLQHLRSLID